MANPWTVPNTGPRINFQDEFDASTISGRSAVVTGGGAGIGRGCVEGLAKNGAYVTFCDVNETEGKAVEQELTEQGLKVKFVKTDVTSWEAIVQLFKAAIAFSPKETVDIVIPNAGVAGPPIGYWLAQTPLNSITKDPLPPNRRVLDVNYLAVWNTVHAATFYFKNFSGPAEDKHSKLIIFVSSMGGYTPMPTVIDYSSSKWGVRGLFWSLRNTQRLLGEGKPDFRVNLIAPSWIRTNMTKGFQAAVKNRDLNVKIGDVSDCVDVVLRMAADESVIGRAAAIAPEKLSFDLGDESEGAGVGKVLTDPEYLRRLGYVADKKAETKIGAPKTEIEQAEKVEEEVARAEVVPKPEVHTNTEKAAQVEVLAATEQPSTDQVVQSVVQPISEAPKATDQSAANTDALPEPFAKELISEIAVSEVPKADSAIAVK